MNNNFGGLEQLLFPILGDLYGWGKSVIQKINKPRMYEVLDYESTLELLDSKGENAIFQKVEKVKFMQDNIIAFQDQAWSDGKFLREYMVSPGEPVDRYRKGYKTIILISLRDIVNKGDIKKFMIKWKIKGGFKKKHGFWETSVDHKTKNITIQVIFPEDRPPIGIIVVREPTRLKRKIKQSCLKEQLSDDRWIITWNISNPRIDERYILNWDW
jgi:hypothetical protein